MEARLFFIAIWCGVYGGLIRVLTKKPGWRERSLITMLLNGFFWATVGVVAGMLIASYTDALDSTTYYSLIYGLGGFVLGGSLAMWKANDHHRRENLIKDDLEWADTGFSAILLASVVMFFIVQAFKIPSGSMRMTFLEGDHLFVNKFIYGVPVPFTDKKLLHFRSIHRGDIVIFKFPAKSKDSPHYGKDFIKRTIALEGQEVRVVNKKVFVDGVEQNEPYTEHVDNFIFPSLPGLSKEMYQQKWQDGEFASIGNEIRDNFGPVKVPPGCILVMGDNRDRSFDSRFWGPLKVSAVKGKAWLLYWPWNRFHLFR